MDLAVVEALAVGVALAVVEVLVVVVEARLAVGALLLAQRCPVNHARRHDTIGHLEPMEE